MHIYNHGKGEIWYNLHGVKNIKISIIHAVSRSGRKEGLFIALSNYSWTIGTVLCSIDDDDGGSGKNESEPVVGAVL